MELSREEHDTLKYICIKERWPSDKLSKPFHPGGVNAGQVWQMPWIAHCRNPLSCFFQRQLTAVWMRKTYMILREECTDHCYRSSIVDSLSHRWAPEYLIDRKHTELMSRASSFLTICSWTRAELVKGHIVHGLLLKYMYPKPRVNRRWCGVWKQHSVAPKGRCVRR